MQQILAEAKSWKGFQKIAASLSPQAKGGVARITRILKDSGVSENGKLTRS